MQTAIRIRKVLRFHLHENVIHRTQKFKQVLSETIDFDEISAFLKNVNVNHELLISNYESCIILLITCGMGNLASPSPSV